MQTPHRSDERLGGSVWSRFRRIGITALRNEASAEYHHAPSSRDGSLHGRVGFPDPNENSDTTVGTLREIF